MALPSIQSNYQNSTLLVRNKKKVYEVEPTGVPVGLLESVLGACRGEK